MPHPTVVTDALPSGPSSGPNPPVRETPVNDTNDTSGREPAEMAEPAPSARTSAVRRAAGSQRTKIAAALVLGGVAGAAILGPIATLAVSPAPVVSTAPASGTGTTGTTGTGATAEASEEPNEVHGGLGGHTEAVTDTS